MDIAFKIGLPQVVYLLLNFGLLAFIIIYGTMEDIKNALIQVVSWCLITLPILYWGGFFS